MKKLLLLLLMVSMVLPIFAGDGKEILNAFWFSNMMAGSYADQYNVTDSDIVNEEYALGDNNKGWYHLMNFFNCGFDMMVLEKDFLTIDMMFYGGLALIKEMDLPGITIDHEMAFDTLFNFDGVYTLGLGTGYHMKLNAFDGSAGVSWTHTRFRFKLENSIQISHIMTIDFNITDEISWQHVNDVASGYSADGRPYTNMDLIFLGKLSGSYGMGFSWYAEEEVTVGIDLEHVGNDDDLVIANRYMYTDWRPVPLFRTAVGASMDVLAPLNLEHDISLVIGVDQVLWINKPYSAAEELDATISTQGKYGITFGAKGFTLGANLISATADFVNLSNAPSDNNGRGQLGVLTTIGFSKKFFSMELGYKGMAQIRDNDLTTADIGSAGPEPAQDYLFDNYDGWYPWHNQIDLSFTFSW